jgi:phosphohistidine phosphatase SixA
MGNAGAAGVWPADSDTATSSLFRFSVEADVMIRCDVKFGLWLLLVLFVSSGYSQEVTPPTTWYVVRHADRDGSHDALTEAGVQRSDRLAELMQILRVNHIYSTDTKRTRNTAGPTAAKMSLPVKLYGDLDKAWFDQLKGKHPGDVVLIVGHSNTADKIVEGLGGKGNFSLDDDEYDSLFVVSTKGQEARAMRIRYGSQSGKK